MTAIKSKERGREKKIVKNKKLSVGTKETNFVFGNNGEITGPLTTLTSSDSLG